MAMGRYGPGKSAAVLLLLVAFQQEGIDTDTFANVPQTLSGEDYKKARIQHPKSKDAERCTVKCVTTCIRGGAGSPGEGPLNARRPLVVFKEGFHSRKYCLVECSDICNLLKDGEDGP
ncbi:hypothetical protein IFM89_032348 [Coptis chinensis]|uniref:Uncharacterized protein n=1 Tax=Coptis chinensis TaxID=261450 RepID=A0A835M2N9_9MAGN|nr:hypothetical protein IFM89_032348 [Coptis chinensis]